MMNSVSLSIPYLYFLHVLLVSVRVGSTLMFAPIWGHPSLPRYLRVMLVFATAAGVSSLIPFKPEAYLNPGVVLPAEFLIGLLLTMGIRIAFAGLHLGGQLVSYHLGFSMVQAIDPQTQNRSTLMSSYYMLISYVLILSADMHHSMFRALADSYVAFPIGGSIPMNHWFDAVITASAQIFIVGWKIALPVFAATFILEAMVGLVARMQPQLNLMVISAPLKLLVGIVVLGASLAFLPRVIAPVVETMVLKR